MTATLTAYKLVKIIRLSAVIDEVTMSKFKATLLLFCCGISFTANAYMIGGAYASLVSCNWGQIGYEYGYIGTYDVNGKLIQVFFGSSYCQH